MKNSKKTATRLVAMLGAIAAVALMAQPIFAQKAFLTKLKKMRPELVEKKLANCHLCHEYSKEKKEEATKENLNAFAKDLKNEPDMKTIIGLKDGDEHKYTDEELALFEKSFNSLLGKAANGYKAKLDKGEAPVEHKK